MLIDLKIDKLTHQDLGQMMMYVHYYDRYEKLPEDANIYASEYQLYLLDKKELQKKLKERIEEGPDL